MHTVLVVLAIASAVDFFAYGMHLRHFAALVGLLLLAYGNFKASRPPSIIGAIVVIGATAAKYL